MTTALSAGDGRPLIGRLVFLSVSIPDASRLPDVPFDPLAITDASVAAARALFTAGAGIVTGAHPTIAPLLLYVARELPRSRLDSPSLLVFQSRLFEDVLPPATRELADGGLAEFRWTAATLNDEPVPGRWNASLAVMRAAMLDTDPIAAIFLGGMDGVTDEFALFRARFPGRPTYAIAAPGGVAAALIDESPSDLVPMLRTSRSYPAVLRRIVEDLATRI